MKSEIVALSLAVLIVASLGAGYLFDIGNFQSPTRASTYAFTSIATTPQSDSQRSGSPISIASIRTASILIGGSPRTMAVNPNSSRIFVEDWFSKNLTVVNATSHSVITTVTLPADANNGIAIDYNTNTVYALVTGGVAILNGSTNKVVGELTLNFGPGSLAYNPSTHIIYGSSETLGNGSIIGVDVRTGSEVASVPLGYWANSLAVDSHTNMIYAVGCSGNFVCGSLFSIVDGTSGTLLRTIKLGSAAYPRVTVDPKSNVVYVSGQAQLTAFDGTDGTVIYNSNPQTCGPFDSLAVIPSTNQILAISLNFDYVFVYSGASGALVNMYSSTSEPQFVAFNSNTQEAYVSLFHGSLLAFHPSAEGGHVNSTLVGSGQNCLPP